MTRTPLELDAAALALTQADKDAKKAGLSPLEITPEEAALLVEQHRMARRSQGKIAPEARYVMKKLRSGKAQIHGHHVVVKE